MKIINPSKELYLSSQNNGDVSLTIKGIVLAFFPLVVSFANAQGIEITQNDLVELLSAVTGAVAGIQIVLGLFRKVYNKVITKP